MTDREHLAFDEAQESIKAAVLAVQAFYEAMSDHPLTPVKSRGRARVENVLLQLWMSLDALEDASKFLAAARVRFAEQQQKD